MVKPIFLILLFYAMSLRSVEINARIDNQKIEALDTVKGSIQVKHSPDEEVDVQSFLIDSKPLEVDFVKRLEDSSGSLTSIYEFQIYPKNEGLNILPKISAVVNGKRYLSNPSTYSLEFSAPKSGLHIRALILGKEPFYPGERLKFVYRIYYRGNVQLTKEELPLLKAEGFEKIGGLDVKETKYEGYQVNEFTQEVQTLAPGEYSFGKTVLEGVVNGQENVRSEVESFTITVSPFPVLKQPPSFTGASGRFDIIARLISNDQVIVGDKVQLEIEIVGSGNLDNINLPNFVCQPGFSGFFSSGVLPPISITKDNRKIYKVEFIPLTPLVKEIPSFEFSSFDPATRDYHTSKSNALPISVTSRPFSEALPPRVKNAPLIDWEKTLSEKKPIEPLPIPQKNLVKDTKPIDPWNALWGIPLFAFLWLLQYYGKDYWIAYSSRKKEKSPFDLIREASKYEDADPKFYQLIKLAFKDDKRSEAVNLMRYLDDIRFGMMEGSKEEVLSKAKKLL